MRSDLQIVVCIKREVRYSVVTLNPKILRHIFHAMSDFISS